MPAFYPTCYTCAYCDRKNITCPAYPQGIPYEELIKDPKVLTQCSGKYHYLFKPLSDNSEPLK